MKDKTVVVGLQLYTMQCPKSLIALVLPTAVQAPHIEALWEVLCGREHCHFNFIDFILEDEHLKHEAFTKHYLEDFLLNRLFICKMGSQADTNAIKMAISLIFKNEYRREGFHYCLKHLAMWYTARHETEKAAWLLYNAEILHPDAPNIIDRFTNNVVVQLIANRLFEPGVLDDDRCFSLFTDFCQRHDKPSLAE